MFVHWCHHLSLYPISFFLSSISKPSSNTFINLLHPFVRSTSHPSVHPSAHIFIMQPYTNISIFSPPHPSNRLSYPPLIPNSLHLSSHPIIYPFLPLFIPSLIQSIHSSFFDSTIQLSTWTSIHPPTNPIPHTDLFSKASTNLFIYLITKPSTHPSTQLHSHIPSLTL